MGSQNCTRSTNNYVTHNELEEYNHVTHSELEEFKNELKNEIERVRSDLSQKIGYLYEAMLIIQLPMIIQSYWKLVAVFPGSYKLYRREQTNDGLFSTLQQRLSNRSELTKFTKRRLDNITEVEINFFQPYNAQQDDTMKVINLSPTKQCSMTGATCNTIVIAEATISFLGFKTRGGTRAKLLEKLSQFEIQIEWLKIHYKIENLEQFRVLLVSPGLRGVEWEAKTRQLLDKHKQTFVNLKQLFEKNFFFMLGI